MSDIQQCRQIIAQLERDYNQEHKTTFIDIVPDKIIEISTMALWAQSISGAKKMDLGLPAPKAWLRKLAARGPAEQAETYKGVMFAFIKQEPISRPVTLPLSYEEWIRSGDK